MMLKSLMMSVLCICFVSVSAMNNTQSSAGGTGFVQENFFESVAPSFPLGKHFLVLPAIGFCAASAVVLANKSPQSFRGLSQAALIQPAGLVGFFVGLVAYCQQLGTYAFGACDLFVGSFGLSQTPSKHFKRGIVSLALGVPLSIIAGYYCDVASAEKAAHFGVLNPLHAFGK